MRLSRKNYDPRPLIALLKRLLKEHNETPREASLASGLDHGAVGRFLRGEGRPHRDACIVLAEHFGANPNELLMAAGYAPMPLFDLSLADVNEFPPEVKAVALTLNQIRDSDLRSVICKSIQTLVSTLLQSGNSGSDVGRLIPRDDRKVHSSGSPK